MNLISASSQSVKQASCGVIMHESGVRLRLEGVGVQSTPMTEASEGSVLPWAALPAATATGQVGLGGPAGHFLPPCPARHPPSCLRPAVWQTFLGLLIDIQEWNLSLLSSGCPERACTQALTLPPLLGGPKRSPPPERASQATDTRGWMARETEA